MKCNDNSAFSVFSINYKKKTVKFKPKLLNRKVMSLKEFALSVLGIDPISTEIIALYIGKMGFDTYNKGLYEITITKKVKNGIKGTIRLNEKR